MPFFQHRYFAFSCSILLGVLAGFVNLLPFWFLDSSEFLFGQLFVLICLLLFGLRYALVACTISAAFIFYRWGHCWPSIVFVGEVLWLYHFSFKTARLLFIRGIIYWLLIGIPLLGLIGYFIIELPLLAVITALVKYFLNAAIVLCVIDLLSFFFIQQVWQKRPNSLYKILNYIVSILIILVVLLTTIVLTNNHYARIEYEVKAQLAEKSEDIAEKIDLYLNGYRRGIVLTAKAIEQGVDKQLALSQLMALYPNFLTSMVTDENAIAQVFNPLSLQESLKGSNLSVADRDYFTIGKDSPTGYISNVFRGRGFGNEPIVGVSAPVHINGRFQGVVEGSLVLGSFLQFRPTIFDNDGELIILDAKKHVVFSTLPNHYSVLTQLTEDKFTQLQGDQQAIMTTDIDGEQYYVKIYLSQQQGWYVASLLKRKYANLVAASAWGQSLLLTLVVIILISIFITQLSRWLVRPIDELTEQIDAFDPKAEISDLQTQNNAWLEVLSLQQQFATLAFKLTSNFKDLEQVNTENAALNLHLKQFNVELEYQVNEKTDELVKAVATANQASKAKSQFLANMSHEIRTPLNGIMGLTDILLNADDVKLEYREQLQMIQQSAKNLLLILNDILDFSKIEAGAVKLDIHIVNVRKLLTQLAQVFTNTGVQPGVEFILNIAPSVPDVVQLDSLRLSQIVNNLLSNAGKFTKTGSITMNIDYADNHLSVAVTDTGIGISGQQQSSLFREFTQADISTTRQYGGTGLGLTICKRIVQLMGGKLKLHSEIGKGSCFTITIPIEVAQLTHEVDIQQSIPDLTGLKVLLVEDNQINQIVIAKMLSDTHCTLEVANDGEKALACLQHNMADIILMDCQMPIMDGYQCTAEIRNNSAQFGPVIIIAITANAFEDDQKRCLEVGMDDFIAKPVDRGQLFQCLKKWADTLS
ncbi:response regulator [Pseudoalteromonas sp. SG41-5]|nr:response regulator [Pseudoalteromonas sp. SG41-5]